MFEQISINQVEETVREMGAILIDLRSREEYEKGHIKGAISLPFEELERKFFYRKNQPVVVYCEMGSRSMRASRWLYERGYQVVNTVGGIQQYTGVLVKE